MSALELKAYEVLKSKLGENEASTLIEYFDSKSEQKFSEKKEILATKEDVTNLRADLLQKIESAKSDMVKMDVYFLGWTNSSNLQFYSNLS